MRLQFWIDYILAARREFVELGSCALEDDPMRCALNECFKKADAAVADAVQHGFVYCTHAWRGRGEDERLVLRFRLDQKRFQRTIARVSSFATEDGHPLKHGEAVEVVIALANVVLWEGKVKPDPRETWMSTARAPVEQA